jgi:diacylglycerol kinase (ATP)
MVKRLFGHRLAYVVGLLRALMSYRAPRIRVSSGDQQWEDRFLFVCASNAETSGGGMRIAPGARVDDGLLNLNFIDAVGRLQAVRHLAQLFRGEHVTHPRVRYFPATELSIDADQPLAVALDGDLAGSTPARFTVKPGALKIVRLRR